MRLAEGTLEPHSQVIAKNGLDMRLAPWNLIPRSSPKWLGYETSRNLIPRSPPKWLGYETSRRHLGASFPGHLQNGSDMRTSRSLIPRSPQNGLGMRLAECTMLEAVKGLGTSECGGQSILKCSEF